MSIVQALLPGARIVDLFAGSGALGLEALSRGAASADLIEEAPAILQVLRANVAALGAEESAHVVRADAIRFIQALGPGTYDVAFADPPYAGGLAAAVAERWLSMPFAAVLGVEHAAGVALPAGGGMTRRYGSAAVTVYGL